MKRTASLALIAVIVSLIAAPALARGGGGGGRSGGFSSSRSFSTSSRTTTSKPAAAVKPPSQSSFKAPAPKPPAPVGKAATQKPSSKFSNFTKSKTLGSSQSFRRGYVAPAGSQVYYQSSPWDWLPFYFLATHGSHQQAVVVQPDGKEVKVEEPGIDGMYVFNWIVVILLGLGLIGGIMYLVYRYTNNTPKGQYA
jgi:hypothetical protein